MSGADETHEVNREDLAAALEFDGNIKTQTILQYLGHEGLIRDFSDQIIAKGGCDEYIPKWGIGKSSRFKDLSKIDPITITHKGIKEVEQAIENPQSSTEHFPPNIIYIMGNVSNSPIQQASNHAYQSMSIAGSRLEELKEIMESLNKIIKESSIGEDNKEELKAEVIEFSRLEG